ncbi:hypothetical protein SGFS_002200 [Streptomyces graminofaciens]|uniref:Uncharacterized protein n=1 Tax=Streptomyces graminofaciens TaxID=68212 RepID=A0ABN5V7L2_9ACTN|nr:hypothetical protein SGFS_002200 [Streptomyces graminofaciens]
MGACSFRVGADGDPDGTPPERRNAASQAADGAVAPEPGERPVQACRGHGPRPTNPQVFNSRE